MADFSQRTILVTGAAGGLGSALCRRLMASGAHVIGTDIDANKRAALAEYACGEPGTLSLYDFDQSRPEAVAEFVGTVVADHGAVDSLVNNAAIYPKASAAEMAVEEFEAVQAVNVTGHAAFVKALAPAMREAGFGRIVNVASITFDIGFTELSAYVASKGALIALTRVWARELGPFGITVNAISPGAFQTDAEKIHPDPEGYSRFVIDNQAVKRRGTPDDFAHLAAFLLARETSFITGQTIRVDGGWVMA